MIIVPSNVSAAVTPDPQTLRVTLPTSGNPANVAFISNNRAYVTYYGVKKIQPVTFTTNGGSVDGTSIIINQFDGYGASATPSGAKFYSATSGSTTVVNTTDNSFSQLTGTVGQNVVACSDYVYVGEGSQVRIHSVADNSLFSTFTMPAGYYITDGGGAKSSDGLWAFFCGTNYSGSYQVFVFSSGVYQGIFVSQANPFTMVAATNYNNIWCAYSSAIYKYTNLSLTSSTTSIHLGMTDSHKPFAVSPSGHRLYCGCGTSIKIIDTATMTVINTITPPGLSSTWGMAVSPDGSWVSTVDLNNSAIYGIGV